MLLGMIISLITHFITPFENYKKSLDIMIMCFLHLFFLLLFLVQAIILELNHFLDISIIQLFLEF